MILLPDMTILGYAVSLQSPYTINGYLITNIQELTTITNTFPDTQRLISINYIDTDENGMSRMCTVRFNRSSFFVFNETSGFLQEHGPGCDENGRWVLKDGLPLTFEKWFEYVKKQTEPFTQFCVSATPGSAGYIKLVKRLIKQCRAERYLNNPLYAEPITAAFPVEPVNSDSAPENETFLLPDVEVSGITLSLQAPYTIDGYLITNIREFLAQSLCDECKIIDISYYDLNQQINNTKRFWATDIYEAFSPFYFCQSRDQGEAENGETNFNADELMDGGYDKWRRGVDKQCSSFWGMELRTISTSVPYLALVKRLIKQNRAEKYLQYEVYRNLRFSTSSSGGDSDTDNIRRGARAATIGGVDFLSRMRETMRQRTNEFRFTFPDSDKKYIHPYNYKPDYIKYTDDHSSLLLGVEIEVAGNEKPNESANREKVVKKCIQIMNGSESDCEDLIYSTSDSSVQIELDTMPCSLTYHKKLNYREMFDYLDKEGYKGHDCEKAGLHVHANRDYLGDTEFQQQITIMKIIYLLEKFNNEICVIARRDENYSPFSGRSENDPIEKLNKYKQKGKNVALNLQHSETIEFRCFKSTLKYESFILILEFVQSIIDFAKSINIEEIESVTWSDLMRKFPTSVTEYYYERLKLTKKKLAKKKRKELNKMKKKWEKEKNPLHKKKLLKEMERVRKESLKVEIKNIVDIEEAERAIAALNGDTIFCFNGVPISAPITASSASSVDAFFLTASDGSNELGLVSNHFSR